MKNAAVGVRVHSGWSALVAVCVENGEPVVLCRERTHLVKVFNYSFRQPYHTAARVPIEEGRAFISQVRVEARVLAFRALKNMQASLREAGYKLTHSGLLLAAGKPLPSLERILGAHPLIHTADGELFREALSHAAGKCGLKQMDVKEKELLSLAAKSLRRKEALLLKLVTEIGKSIGAPWSQDEKYATLVAWLALCDGEKSSRTGGKTKQA